IARADRGDELRAAEAVRALAVVRAVVRLAVDVRAAARAVDRLVRGAIGALGLDARELLRVRLVARDLVRAARHRALFRVAREGGVCRELRARLVLSIRARDAAAEVIHQAEARLALEALRLDVDFLLVEAVERGIVLLLGSARIAVTGRLASL